MLQAANTDLFNPLAHNSEYKKIYYIPGKVS